VIGGSESKPGNSHELFEYQANFVQNSGTNQALAVLKPGPLACPRMATMPAPGFLRFAVRRGISLLSDHPIIRSRDRPIIRSRDGAGTSN